MADRSEEQSRAEPSTRGRNGNGNGNGRKFSIRSNFGRAREPRSRKNRPCDVCRRRKTACVITEKPPCLFCKGRGLECRSSGDVEAVQRLPDCRDGLASTPELSSLPDPEDSPGSQYAFQSPRPISRPAAVVHSGLTHQSAGLGDEFGGALTFGPSPEAEDGSGEDRALQSLEDIGDRTAHAMGLAAEQDTHFLDAFRSLLISEQDEVDANIVQVYPGGHQPDDHPIHFLILQNEFPEHTNRAMQAASDSIEALVWPHGPVLIRLYFKHVHPVYPIISKPRFLRQYLDAKDTIPASLRGAVYALACVFWDRDQTLPSPCPFEQYEVINHAHDALRRELEAPNLSKLQACLLLLHVLPPDIDSVETPKTWILTAQATACAQMIGLNQDPELWNIEPWEKKLRRKLWWAAYMADCFSAVCHGNPSHISPDSFNTRPPVLDDLRFDEDVPDDLKGIVDADDGNFQVSTGARFLEMVNLARHLRAILDCSFQVNKTTSTLQSRARLVELHKKLKDWSSLLPNCLAVGPGTRPTDSQYNGPLHLAFYATQVLLFRGLMHPATKVAKATPGSNLRQTISIALVEIENFTTFMSHITKEDLNGFWGRHARSQLILCGNFLIYLFLWASEPHDVEAAYRLLESFHQSLQRLGNTQNVAARLLLRPAVLRIDSFFIQAAELIKQGHAVQSIPAVMR